ncbi:uncharacterized protein [Centruroides vittatus]|uniref:uncharacterized protein n=1 Tax=Centruroides vittatus TaxID=120091 RepID=UPI00350ECFEA
MWVFVLLNLLATYGQRPVTGSVQVDMFSSPNSAKMDTSQFHSSTKQLEIHSSRTQPESPYIQSSIMNTVSFHISSRAQPESQYIQSSQIQLKSKQMISSRIKSENEQIRSSRTSREFVQLHSTPVLKESKNLHSSRMPVRVSTKYVQLVSSQITAESSSEIHLETQPLISPTPAYISITKSKTRYLSNDQHSSNVPIVTLKLSSMQYSNLEKSPHLNTPISESKITYQQISPTPTIARSELQYSTDITWSPPLDVTSPIRISGKQSKDKVPSLYDIIGGIIHLFDGDAESNETHVSRIPHQEKSVYPSRKNDRGPAKIYPLNSDKSVSISPKIYPTASIPDHVITQSPFVSTILPLKSSIELDSLEQNVETVTKTSVLPDLMSSSLLNVFKSRSENPSLSTSIIKISSVIHDSEKILGIEDSVSIKQISKSIGLQSEVPSGPVTDWVPLIDRPTVKAKPEFSANTTGLSIITEPSVFDITIVNSIEHSDVTRDFPVEHSTRSNTDSVYVPNENIDHTSPMPDYEAPNEEAAEIDEVIVTLLGSGTLKSESSTVTSSSSSVGPATGRPYVIPVDIEEVRPFIGAQIPSQPTSKPNGHVQIAAAGINVADENNGNNSPSQKHPTLLRPGRPRVNPPIIRIDTCIVGDDTTCDDSLNEYCKAEQGISSCQCRPGYARTFPRGPCQGVVSVLVSIRIDRIGDQKIIFNRNYLDPNNQIYQQMEYEARQAINSLFSYTSFARSFMGTKINKFYSLGSKLIVNSTILFDETAKSSILRQKIRQEMVKVISSRNQNIGESQLYVDGPLNPVPAIEDLNECADASLNDCSSNGYCKNLFGSFRCFCNAGFMDKNPNDQRKSGKTCTSCSSDYCNNHGICIISNGITECKCRGNYIGYRCETDGEVVGVSVGASLAAAIIIILTLVCLCVWNRRWKREQHKAEMASVPSMASFGNKSLTPINTYRLTIEDRVRWAHIADAMGNGYMPNERPGRPHPNKTEREDNYYGHPGRPKPRMCVSNTPPNGYYNQDFLPRDAYHPLSNRIIPSASRSYYN